MQKVKVGTSHSNRQPLLPSGALPRVQKTTLITTKNDRNLNSISPQKATSVHLQGKNSKSPRRLT